MNTHSKTLSLAAATTVSAVAVMLLLVVAAAPTAQAWPSPLGTAFTYQGQLKKGGSAYSGVAEFQFRLYDAASAGNQVGSQIALTRGNAPTVSNGLFKVTLDFGLDGNGFPAFSGEARWLEIDVRTGAGAYTTLTPRQAITATPYALATQYALTTRGIAADASGNVGIGTTTPANLLHVVKGGPSGFAAHALSPLIVEGNTHSYISILSPVGTEAGILFRNPVTTTNAGAIIFDSANTPSGLEFRTGGNMTRMVITQDGNVGIGTDNPAGVTLFVEGTGSTSIYGENDFTNGRGVVGHASGTSGKGVYGFASKLTGVNYGVYGISNSATGYDFYAGGAGIDFGTSSSIRWKHNITPIADPLERVERIRGVWYDWDAAHGGKHDVGMIAEEVGRVMPEIVAYEANGVDANGMDYGKLTPLLVEAVKALRAEKDDQIAQQQEQIAALQDENQHLRDRLAALEAAVARLAHSQPKH